jgi:hypothetical protein
MHTITDLKIVSLALTTAIVASSSYSVFARSHPTKVAQIDSRPLRLKTTDNNPPCKSTGLRLSASNISKLH